MDKEQERGKLSLRSKSPIIMSSRQKMALLNCNEQSTSNIHELNDLNPKKIQETKVLSVKTTVVHPPKIAKHLNFNSNLQSTPNTRHFSKSIKESRTIMNLSPIISSVETNLNNSNYIFHHKLHKSDEIKKPNSLNLNVKQELDNKLKINENMQKMSNSTITDSLVLSVNTRKKNDDNIKEKPKRCLFEKEKEKEIDVISNFDADQDSLNISLDILEQVCQMSEIMDDSLTEELKISDSEEKKKKLAYFLYGNNTTKLDDTEEENELLQLALSMEDNLKSETKSKTKLCFEKEFTSLNQLTNKETNCSENDKKQYNNKKLQINVIKSGSKLNLLDHSEIDDIGNTQMCEIADITEPLESFDDHWTQQYPRNSSNFSNENTKNTLFNNSLYSNQNTSDSYLNITKNNIVKNSNTFKGFSTAGDQHTQVSDKTLHKAQSILIEENNDFSSTIKDKTIINSNICTDFSSAGDKSIKVSDIALHKAQSILKEEINVSSNSFKDETIINSNSNTCKGFSTAAGKSIKVSDMALHKVQLLLKDELNDSSTTIKDKTIINSNSNICKGFSTAAGKSIKVSNMALHKAQSLLKDELNDSSTTIKDKTIINSSSNTCKGFSTAAGKSIKVSDMALHKVQLLLKDELNDSSTTIKDKTIINSNSNICKGFSTAAGKSIKVSNMALHKAQSLLKDELNDSSTTIKDKTIINSSSNTCKGFSTAAGKSIKVSDMALYKAQLLLKDEPNDSSTTIKDKTIINSSSNTCKGFSTAAGKSIKVSDMALHKAQSLLKDELDDSSTTINDKTIINSNSNTCKGFSTAAGKSIKVSDMALYKAQLLLKDEPNDSSTTIKDKTIINSSSNTCKGFSTAAGKSIKVSDMALHKAQSLLKDELDDSSTTIEDKTIINSNSNTCKGFSTAAGKSIKVSDMALHKAQSLLNDEYNDSSFNINDKTIMNLNICKRGSTGRGQSFKVSDEALQKVQSLVDENIEDNESQLFIDSHKRMSIPNYSEVNTTKSTIISKSNCNFFEISKSEEECVLEDLSLIDTVEKFEKEQMADEPVLRNKRPGSPLYETNHKIKKKFPNERWERDELKTSFEEYLGKKLNGPKVSLSKAVEWGLPRKYHSKQLLKNNIIRSEFFKVNIDNSINLKLFWEKDSESPDGCKNKMYNFQDIENFFLTHDLVDEKLIPKGWIDNHFRLIAWKLAATEISFPDHFGNKLLTAKNMIHQLLLRYYVEIEKCKRSSLKKILEKDESATKRIILCVSRVVKENTADTYNIELTDGWYSIQALIDFEMNMLIHKGIIKVGTKLMIFNAELLGAGEGIDPLDVHDGLKLKVSTNSTRRVRWYAKLGFYKNATLPMPITLESVLPRGGIIGSLSFVVLRKYPMMYLERKANSKSILRNEKMEIIEADKFKAYQQKSLEIISNKVKTELIAEMASKTKKQKNYILSIKKENLEKLSIDELSNVVENSTDPLEIQSLLSQEKLEDLKNFKKSEQEKFYYELQNRVNKVFNDQFKDIRKVTPLLKLRIVDEKYASSGFKSAILTIWNPSEDVSNVLSTCNEGQCCTCHNLITNGFINGELHLSANKNTRFYFKGLKNEYIKRDVVSFKNLWSGNFFPLYGELDFVGIVVSDVIKNNSLSCEIYASDKEMNTISIVFRSDLKDYGCDDMMNPGHIISGINIQFRGFDKKSSMPKLYTTEQTSFTSIPRSEYLINVFNDYKMFMSKPENQDFVIRCQSKFEEICDNNIKTIMINSESPKQQCSNTSKNEVNRSYEELPRAILKTSNSSLSEFSPAQKRIKLLKSYGKTPPLNIIHTKPPDKKLLSQFKTPTRL